MLTYPALKVLMNEWVLYNSFNAVFTEQKSVLDTPIISNVLPLGSDAVQVDFLPIDLHRVVAILLNDTFGLLEIFFLSLWLPPIDQITVTISLTALIVKPVGDLMATGKSQGSIVHVPRSAHIEDLSGENSGANIYCIVIWIVKSIQTGNSNKEIPVSPLMSLPENGLFRDFLIKNIT